MDERSRLALSKHQFYNLFMSQSFNLYQLQKIDSRIDQFNLRIDQLKTTIEDRSVITALESDLISAQEKSEEIFGQIDQHEEDVEKKKIKVNQSEASLYGGKVQNPKELQALQAEIESINRSIQEKQTSLAELIKEFEASEKLIEVKKQALQSRIFEKEDETSRLQNEIQRLEKELGKANSERLLAISQVKPEYLKKYDDIRFKRKNIAVALVEDDTCSACGVSLTPSEWQTARSTDQIVFCPSCSRILYAG